MNLDFKPELSNSGKKKMNEFLKVDKVFQSLNKYCPNSNLMHKNKIVNDECNLCERRYYEICLIYKISKNYRLR